MKKIKEFWRESYVSDPLSFVVEMIGFMFIVGASMTLALTANKPNMAYIFPAYFIGNICAIIAYFRRKLAWQLTSAGYFFIINIFGFGRAINLW